MRLWWVFVAACGSKSTPVPATQPPPAQAPQPQPPPPPAPKLGADLAIVNDDETAILRGDGPLDAAPVVVLHDRIFEPTWGDDHHLYGAMRERKAVAIDGTNVREIAIPEAKPDKERGHRLPPDRILAFVDGSVWLEECWGPKTRPMANHCGSMHRVRLDAPGEDYELHGNVEIRKSPVFPPVQAPAGFAFELTGHDAKVTCPDGQHMDLSWVSEIVWLSREPPLFAAGSRGYRGCDHHDESVDISVGRDGYYVYRVFNEPSWKLARDGKVIRDLGFADDVVFSP